MNYKKYKLLNTLILLSISITNTVLSEQWCSGGTKVLISDNNWLEEGIITNFPGAIPDWYSNQMITMSAVENYASTFVGGGGSIGGYSAPDSGSVSHTIYSPVAFTPAYSLSWGVKFRLVKCYTIPPMAAVEEVESIRLPPGVIFDGDDETGMILEINSLNGLNSHCEYLSENNHANSTNNEDDFSLSPQVIILKSEFSNFCPSNY